MLVFKRKPMQSFRITVDGKVITVFVLKGTSVIGVEADDDVHVLRSELLTTGKDKEVK